MVKSRKIIFLFLLMAFLTSCSNKEVFSSDTNFYDSYISQSVPNSIMLDDDHEELYFIDNEQRQIIYFNLINNNITPLGYYDFIDGKPQTSEFQKPEKYIQNIILEPVFKEKDTMFMVTSKIENNGNSSNYFSSSNLDGNNLKNLLKLDFTPTEFLMGSGLLIFSYSPDEMSYKTIMKIFDNKLNLINEIEFENGIGGLQIYNEKIYGGTYDRTTFEQSQVYEIDPYTKDVEKVGEEGYYLQVINEGYYLLHKPSERNSEGLAINFVSTLYNLSDHSEVFSFTDQIGYHIKDNKLITSSINGDRIFYRYDLEGNYIDELKPTDYIKENIFKLDYITKKFDDGRELMETDVITLPLRYGKDKVISRILSSDSGPFVICDFIKETCELVEY